MTIEDHMTEAFVIVHEDLGVCFGPCWNPEWSKRDPMAHNQVPAFEACVGARLYMNGWFSEPLQNQCQIHPVSVFKTQVHRGFGYATLEQCVKAGLERWDPSIPDDDGVLGY